MNECKPLLGFCPIGKFVFSNEDAVKYKQLLQAKLRDWAIPFVDLEGVLKDGLVKDQKHVDQVVKHFASKNIDCLFIPHCNFGTEGAAATIAKKLNIPVLLWGPRDDAPAIDGTRLRDTLCGMFATSKVLHKLNVPFTYIENCRIDEPPLKQGLENFMRAVNIADLFKSGTRIGHIGQRIDFFWTTIINESELLERFNIEIVPIDMVEFINSAKNRAKKANSAYKEEAENLSKLAQIEGFKSDEPLINILAVRDQILHLAEELNLESFAIQDFMSLVNEMGTYCLFADSMVAEDYAIGHESDIHGAISDLILRRASFNTQPAFSTDITIRHPDNDNAVLLWHCGAPLSMKHSQDKLRIGHHWILPSPLSGMPHFRLNDGNITIARFDGDRGEYKLAIGQGSSIEGPKTLNNYVWMKVDNWPKWELALIEGPFIHHVAMSYGNYKNALLEACKYIDNLKPVELGS